MNSLIWNVIFEVKIIKKWGNVLVVDVDVVAAVAVVACLTNPNFFDGEDDFFSFLIVQTWQITSGKGLNLGWHEVTGSKEKNSTIILGIVVAVAVAVAVVATVQFLFKRKMLKLWKRHFYRVH